MWRRTRGPERPSDVERIASLAADAGSPVQDVLREVADFRLALETDMLIAAAAADMDRLDLTADAMSSGSDGLTAFHDRVLDRLAESAVTQDRAAEDRARDRRTTRTGRSLAAAAAALAFLGGGFVGATSSEQDLPTETAALERADDQLTVLAGMTSRDAAAGEVNEAAAELHATLEELISEHAGSDPAVALELAKLLREEHELLDAEGPQAVAVLSKVRQLAIRLKRIAPPKVKVQVDKLVAEPAMPEEPKQQQPKPSPSASPSPSAQPKPSSSPSPAPSGSPSSSRSGGSGEKGEGSGELPGGIND